MNALVDPQIVDALYEAAQAGVRIDLIVRGICVLRPGIPGVSHNIQVRSVVGRFLEHSRVFHLENGGEPELYCASADWMERNFFRRIEVAFPVADPVHRQRILQDLDAYLRDDCQTWILHADGHYERLKKGASCEHDAQASLLAAYSAPS
jgi:polyphosphate kinase